MNYIYLFTFLGVFFSCMLFLLISYQMLNSKNTLRLDKLKIKKEKLNIQKEKNKLKKEEQRLKKEELTLKKETEKQLNKLIVIKEPEPTEIKKQITEIKKEEYTDSNPKILINIETREPAEDFKQIGICTKINNVNTNFNSPGNNDETIILPLWGKRLYRRALNWNYYLISDKNNYRIPLTIDDKDCSDTTGCREIMDGDNISIPEYNGLFKVKLYKPEYPKYIPYIN